jgi:hypothetical protein
MTELSGTTYLNTRVLGEGRPFSLLRRVRRGN